MSRSKGSVDSASIMPMVLRTLICTQDTVNVQVFCTPYASRPGRSRPITFTPSELEQTTDKDLLFDMHALSGARKDRPIR